MPTSRDPVKRAAQMANLTPAPPAPPTGNRRGVRHGAYAQIARERIEARARDLFDALAEDAPVRESGGLPPADGVVVRLLAEVLLRIDDVGAHIAEYGWADRKGNPRPVLLVEARLRSQAIDLLDRLGMTPRSRAALGLDLVRAGQALDLARHWAEQDDGDD